MVSYTRPGGRAGLSFKGGSFTREERLLTPGGRQACSISWLPGVMLFIAVLIVALGPTSGPCTACSKSRPRSEETAAPTAIQREPP
jgi:hypothetical protein